MTNRAWSLEGCGYVGFVFYTPGVKDRVKHAYITLVCHTHTSDPTATGVTLKWYRHVYDQFTPSAFSGTPHVVLQARGRITYFLPLCFLIKSHRSLSYGIKGLIMNGTGSLAALPFHVVVGWVIGVLSSESF